MPYTVSEAQLELFLFWDLIIGTQQIKTLFTNLTYSTLFRYTCWVKNINAPTINLEV